MQKATEKEILKQQKNKGRLSPKMTVRFDSKILNSNGSQNVVE